MALEETKQIILPQKRQTKLVMIGFAGLLLRGTVTDFSRVLFGENPTIESIIDIIAVSMFIIGLYEILRSCSKVVIGSLFVFSLIWLFSYYFYPENKPYIIAEYQQFFIYTLPFLWMGYYLVKSNALIDLVVPIAKIKLILALLVQILILLHFSPDIFGGDHQTTSYSLIFGLTVLYYKYTKERRIDDIILCVLGTLVLLLVGSRSIFISVIFYWVVYYFLTVKHTRNVVVFLLLALFLLLVGLDPFINSLSRIAESVGYSTHLSESLSEKTMFEDDNRMLLYTSFFSFVKESPFGYGVMGDRYLSYSSRLFYKPIYPHNIILEICIDFGYVIGLIIIVFLLVYILKGMIRRDHRTQMTLLILLSSSFIKLLFASTFWWDQLFFMLLGCLLAINHSDKKKQLKTI